MSVPVWSGMSDIDLNTFFLYIHHISVHTGLYVFV